MLDDNSYGPKRPERVRKGITEDNFDLFHKFFSKVAFIVDAIRSTVAIANRQVWSDTVTLKELFHGENRKRSNFSTKDGYAFVARFAEKFLSLSFVKCYMFLCAVLIIINAGINSYEYESHMGSVATLDDIVIYSFLVEIILRVVQDSLNPLAFVWGPKWIWNILDTTSIFVTLVGRVKLFRIALSFRLLKLAIRIHSVQFIFMALTGGLESALYILLLMFMTFYMYAISGLILFRANDPWHFRDFKITFFTLLRVATQDSWGDIMYINYYGCDVYSSLYYTTNTTAVNEGGIPELCITPVAAPLSSTLYFCSFILLENFVIFASFISVMSLALGRSLRIQELDEHILRLKSIQKRVDDKLILYRNILPSDHQRIKEFNLLKIAFRGNDLMYDIVNSHARKNRNSTTTYGQLSMLCHAITESIYFQGGIVGTIVIAGVSVGLTTDSSLGERGLDALKRLDYAIQFVFASEAALRMIGGFDWMLYFEQPWNLFDLLVVVLAFAATQESILLRIVRLLRVFKVVKIIPSLNTTVTAAFHSLKPIFIVAIMLLFIFYFFGVVGVSLFRSNDTWDFGSISKAMMELFMCSVLDNWSTAAYVSLYGCDKFPGLYPDACVNSQSSFVSTYVYFVVFVLLSALVMISLFVGVINVSRDKADEEISFQKNVDLRAAVIGQQHKLRPENLPLYKEVFRIIDITDSHHVGKEEIKFGLRVAGIDILNTEFNRLWKIADINETASLDFSGFLEFMMNLKDDLRRLAAERREERKRRRLEAAAVATEMHDTASVAVSPREVLSLSRQIGKVRSSVGEVADAVRKMLPVDSLLVLVKFVKKRRAMRGGRRGGDGGNMTIYPVTEGDEGETPPSIYATLETEPRFKNGSNDEKC